MWINETRAMARGAVAATLGVLLLAASGTAQQPAPRVITLDEAIQIGLERNPTLRIAENTAELNSLTVRQERGQFLPNLNLTTQTAQGYGRSFSQDEGRIVNQTTNTMQGGIQSNLTIFDGMSNLNSLREARLVEQASTREVTRSRQTVVFNVMSNYLALIEQQEQLRVQQENLSAQEAQEEQIQAYVTAGVRPISDLYQQQATTASARLTLVQTQRALELARMALVRTLNLDPLQEYRFEVPALGDTAQAPAVDLATLTQQALSRRPDLAAAEVRLQAAQQSVRVASATRWPTVSLALGYNSSFTSLDQAGFTDQLNDRRRGSIGLNFSLPVFDRFTTRLARERAQIQVENARINLEQARQSVAIEVRTAALDLQSAQEQLRQAEAQLRAAQLALETSQQRYNVGAATLVELTQARAAQVRAAGDLVNARYGLVFQARLMEYYQGVLAAEVVD